MPKYNKFAVKNPNKTIMVCTMCGFETDSKIANRLHAKHVHKAVVVDFSHHCAACPKSFKTDKEISEHLKSHEKHIRGNKV